MMETFESIQNLGKHGEVDLMLCIFPIKVKAKVTFAAPVTRYFVVILEDRNEMVGVCFSDVFYAEIVDTDGESNRGRLVCPETRGAFALVITLFVEAFFE